MDAGGAHTQGDRWDAGKAGERDVQSLLASEQYKCACLPPLLIASTLEAWHHHSQPLVQRQMEIRSDGSALPSVLA